MLGLLDMSAYSVRLRVLRTRKVFEELEGDYLPTFELIHTAMKGEHSMWRIAQCRVFLNLRTPNEMNK